MSYNSRHLIKIDAALSDECLCESYKAIAEHCRYFMASHHNVLDDSQCNGGCGTKWYEWDDDIKKLSEKFDKFPISFYRIGEDHGDVITNDIIIKMAFVTTLFGGEQLLFREMTEEEVKWFNSIWGHTA